MTSYSALSCSIETSFRCLPACPACPPRFRPLRFFSAPFRPVAPGVSLDGGCEEFRELRLTRSRNWATSASNASYILATLSDPLGLGWNLFGTASVAWQPMLTSTLAPAQTLALVGGLIWSARTAQKAGREVRISAVPVILYALAATLLMLWLLL
ncbi:MAG: hypothetical protein QMD04_04590 [Anaerolineales bacterium]|nr:hypothetical protein [Anaerolineales bacterium]